MWVRKISFARTYYLCPNFWYYDLIQWSPMCQKLVYFIFYIAHLNIRIMISSAVDRCRNF